MNKNIEQELNDIQNNIIVNTYNGIKPTHFEKLISLSPELKTIYQKGVSIGENIESYSNQDICMLFTGILLGHASVNLKKDAK